MDIKKLKPLELQINLKSFCNLRCDYCALPESNKNQSSYDDEGVLLKNLTTLLEKCIIEKYYITKFTLFGAEPLIIKPNVIGEIYNMVCKQYPDIEIKIQTNAVLLTSKYLDILLNTLEPQVSKKLELRVSIDGVKTLHDLHRDNSFDVANNNMIYASQHTPFNIVAMSTTSPDHFNIPEYKNEFINWIEYVRAHGITFLISFVDNRIAGVDDIHIGNTQCVEDYGNFLIENDLIVNSNKFFNIKFCYRHGNSCAKMLFDLSNGSVHQCERGFGEGEPIGNFIIDTLDTIVAARKMLVVNEFISDECNQCEYLNFCKGGCPLSRDEFGITNQCGIIKKILGYIESEGHNYWDYLVLNKKNH